MILRNVSFVLLLALALAGHSRLLAADSASKTDESVQRAQEAIDFFKKADPSLQKFFDTALGYAVFPKIGKGGIGIGGAHGSGVVYEKKGLVGKATLSQVTIGFQLGGQVYSELIFFETQEALDSFKGSRFALSAQASAVAAASGAAAHAKYQLGVLVFTLARGGLMYEASVGGQKFQFKPIQP